MIEKNVPNITIFSDLALTIKALARTQGKERHWKRKTYLTLREPYHPLFVKSEFFLAGKRVNSKKGKRERKVLICKVSLSIVVKSTFPITPNTFRCKFTY